MAETASSTLLTPEKSREAFDRMIEIGHLEVAEEMIRNKEVDVSPEEQRLLLATAYESKAKILQQAEKAGFLEKFKGTKRTGRRLTPQGREFLEKIASKFR